MIIPTRRTIKAVNDFLGFLKGQLKKADLRGIGLSEEGDDIVKQNISRKVGFSPPFLLLVIGYW